MLCALPPNKVVSDVRDNCSEPALKVQYGALLKVLLTLFLIYFSKYR